MRIVFATACLLTLGATLLAGAQDGAPRTEDNAAPLDNVQVKNDQKKDAKGDDKKDAKGDDKKDPKIDDKKGDADKKETPKPGGKGGKKGGKPFEDTSPPIPVTEPDLDPAALKELDKFQGEWKCVSMTRSGIVLAKTDTDRIHLKNEGRHSKLTFLKEEVVRSLIPKPTSKPPQLDMLILSEPDRGKIRHAIYSFEDGQLKISVAAIDLPRPPKFESKRDSGIVLEVWEKVKK